MMQRYFLLLLASVLLASCAAEPTRAQLMETAEARGCWPDPYDTPVPVTLTVPAPSPTATVSPTAIADMLRVTPERVTPPRWEVLLDTSGPLYGPVPTPDATRTATARYALLRLLEHIGEWIVQLSDLLETLSPNRPTADELARTATVFDTMKRVLAARCCALTYEQRDG